MSTDPTRLEVPGQPPASDHTADFSTNTPEISKSPHTQADTRVESGAGATGEWSQNATQAEAPGANATANFTTGPNNPTGRRASAVLQTSLGGYEILGELGRGGMGVVYKAHQRGLNRTVALKMVLAGGHASEEQLKRFLAEARAVAHLQHPNIVQVFDIGENDGLPFFSLEYVDGDPLSKKLAKQPQPPKEAAQMIETIAKAMQYAHENNILHRDLKPANILLTSTGAPKIADFGLAKQIEDADDGGATRTGTVIGTPSYMAPEQARGDTHVIGPATDQYALGAMLYEMLTGRPPFAAARQVDTILQVVKNEPIPPHQLVDKIPADIETICLKALQKDIAKRYASCGEFAEDLGRYLRGEPIKARPVSNVERAVRWCKRNPVVAGLTGFAALLLVGIAFGSTWSAMTLSAKNELLAEETARANLNAENEKKQAAIAKANEAEAKKQEGIAKENEKQAKEQQAIAEAQKKEAEAQAKNMQDYIQAFVNAVELIDDIESPNARPVREALLRLAADASVKMVEQLKTRKDEQAIPTAMALEYNLARYYQRTQQPQKAAEFLAKLIPLGEERVRLKAGSDASRTNLAVFLQLASENRLLLDRDFEASIALATRAVALAQEMVDDSKGDQSGLGKNSKTECIAALAEATASLATLSYRRGAPTVAAQLAKKSLALVDQAIANAPNDAELKAKPPNVQARMHRALPKLKAAQTFLLGSTLFRAGEMEAGLAHVQSVANASKAAWEKNPTSAAARLEYMGRAGMAAEFLAQSGRPEEAIIEFESIVNLVDQALAFDPTGFEVRRTAHVAYYRLGQWREELGRENASEMDQKSLAIRDDFLKKEPTSEKRKIELIMSLARCKQLARADELTQQVLLTSNLDAEMLLDLARGLAQASKQAPDDRKPEYLQKAVALVKRAADQKFRDLVYLEKEIDFKPLWELPEFKAITAEIRASQAEIAAPPTPEVK